MIWQKQRFHAIYKRFLIIKSDRKDYERQKSNCKLLWNNSRHEPFLLNPPKRHQELSVSPPSFVSTHHQSPFLIWQAPRIAGKCEMQSPFVNAQQSLVLCTENVADGQKQLLIYHKTSAPHSRRFLIILKGQKR
jgi:hypothetical protein